MKKISILIAVIILSLSISYVWASTLTVLQTTHTMEQSRVIINANFAALNADKVESGGDISGTTTPSVIDLTITDEGAGTILYYATSGWEALATGTTGQYLISSTTSPYLYWSSFLLGADSVGDNEIDYATVTLVDFTNDASFATTGQTDASFASSSILEIQIAGNDTDILAAFASTSANELNIEAGFASSSDIEGQIVALGGDYITYGGTDLDLDAEIYTRSFNFVIKNPTTTEGEAIVQWSYPYAITIIKVKGSSGSGTTTIQCDERAEATPNTGGTDILTAALEAGTTIASTTALDNATIAADAWISCDIDAVVGGATSTRISGEYTITD